MANFFLLNRDFHSSRDNVVGLVFSDLFPLNMYQTAVHRGERLEFAPVERVEQPEFSKEEGREGAPTSRDPGDDQPSKYDDNSSDDSDDFVVDEDDAICDMQNSELGFQNDCLAQPLHVSVSFEEHGISQ